MIEAVTGDSHDITVNEEHTMTEKFSEDEYRCESDWSDDEDSSSSDTSFFDAESLMKDNYDRSKPQKIITAKTKGELGLDDLPPIEELRISIEENEVTLLGKIHAIVDTLVVIRSVKGMKALDLDTVLFLHHDKPLGRVFDVFGPVNVPFYSVRFNSVDQINEKEVQVGADVYFAAEKSDITLYVFVEDLQKQKGSDASWKDNNEPPVEYLDFSDDEEERRYKREKLQGNFSVSKYIHPLTVEIPYGNNSSFHVHAVQQSYPQQQFMNHQSNPQQHFVNHQNNPQQQFINHQSIPQQQFMSANQG